MVFVYIFLVLILAVLVTAYLMPARYAVEKNIIISKPAADVMARVGDLHYYSKWNPWQQADATATNTITGNRLVPGHQYTWQGKKIGAGSLTLTQADEKHIHFDLQFVKPWKSLAKDNWLFEAWGDGSETKVTWQNAGELPWPMARLMGPLIVKNLGIQFQKGLENLKEMCERQQVI